MFASRMIMRSRSESSLNAILVVLTQLVILPLFSLIQVLPSHAQNFEEQYRQAINDSNSINEELGEEEISLQLTDLNDPRLEKYQTEKESYILVTTYAQCPSLTNLLCNQENQGRLIPLGINGVWVTVYPEVKELFKRENTLSRDSQLRLIQFLGLRPKDPYNTVIEFWVRQDKLIRPCPGEPSIAEQCTISNSPQGIQQWKVWRASRFLGNPPYAFTGLGYSFDWSLSDRIPVNNHNNLFQFREKGPAEFVIKSAEKPLICIERIVPVKDYINPRPDEIRNQCINSLR
jgi:hypothetical protein